VTTFDAQGNRVEGEVKFLETGTKHSSNLISVTMGTSNDIQPKDSTGSLATAEYRAKILLSWPPINGQGW